MGSKHTAIGTKDALFMILKTAYVRFYRAFNFDYLRKRNPGATPDPWDKMEDGSFYPYIGAYIP